jgi:catechol 2,3-dioxygenase-like lactoylglutathione lyase family enzyme
LTKVALLVSDLQVSRRFYGALGFRVSERTDDGIVVTLGDNVLELRADDRAVAGPHYFTPEIDRFPRGTGVEITIETDALDEIYEAARVRDVDIVQALELADTDAAAQVVLADPDGYLLRFAANEVAMIATRPRIVASAR